MNVIVNASPGQLDLFAELAPAPPPNPSRRDLLLVWLACAG